MRVQKVKTVFKALLISLPLVLASCKKDKLGDLVVNAVDNQNSAISSEDVYLYKNASDFASKTYSKKLTTSSAGQVKFVDLTPGEYFVDCDFANALGGTTTIKGSGEVVAGKETTITIKP